MDEQQENGAPPDRPAHETQAAAQLVVTMAANGSVTVEGPIASKVLCYGMLESAREVIGDFCKRQAQQQAQQGIQLATEAGLKQIRKVLKH